MEIVTHVRRGGAGLVSPKVSSALTISRQPRTGLMIDIKRPSKQMVLSYYHLPTHAVNGYPE